MNGFEVFNLNAVRQNAFVGIEFPGHIAYGIFNELTRSRIFHRYA